MESHRENQYIHKHLDVIREAQETYIQVNGSTAREKAQQERILKIIQNSQEAIAAIEPQHFILQYTPEDILKDQKPAPKKKPARKKK